MRAALELGESNFTDGQKGTIWLQIALAEMGLKHKDAAVKAAEKVKQFIEPDSGQYFQATSVIANLTLEEPQRTQQRRDIEKAAPHRVCESISESLQQSCVVVFAIAEFETGRTKS